MTESVSRLTFVLVALIWFSSTPSVLILGSSHDCLDGCEWQMFSQMLQYEKILFSDSKFDQIFGTVSLMNSEDESVRKLISSTVKIFVEAQTPSCIEGWRTCHALKKDVGWRGEGQLAICHAFVGRI